MCFGGTSRGPRNLNPARRAASPTRPSPPPGPDAKSQHERIGRTASIGSPREAGLQAPKPSLGRGLPVAGSTRRPPDRSRSWAFSGAWSRRHDLFRPGLISRPEAAPTVRIIFSRKGFDAGSGGAPSPIISGRPVSLPIPTSRRSSTTYEAAGLGEIVERITKGRIARDALCHEDPMFHGGRCAFGQTGAAQSHLANNSVGIGDAFLFFGLFADEKTGERHHRIFGYLKVEAVSCIGPAPRDADGPSGFVRRHPHTIGEWNLNNTIYLGPGKTAGHASAQLRLTQLAGPTSVWNVPSWLAAKGLSYHGHPARWLEGNRLRTVGRGQEFVSDVGTDPEALGWLDSVIAEIAA